MTDPAAAHRQWVLTAAVAAGLVALVGWSAWQRYTFLASSPYPMGVDGYFYPIQLRSILEHGTLRYPASPLAFWLMAPFAALTDPITGAKLGAAIGGALIALPAYAVGKQLGGGRTAGLVAATIAATSAGSWYLSVEFVKNGWGLTIALTAVWLILRATELPSRRRVALGCAAVIAAALTHKMAIPLIVVLAGPAVVVARRGDPTVPRAKIRARSRVWLAVGIAVAAAATVTILLAVVAPQRFVAGRDLALIRDVFTSTAHWNAPALSLDHDRFQLIMDHEARNGGLVALIAAAGLVLGFVLRDRPWWHRPVRARPDTAAAIAVVAFAVFVALPWLDVGDPEGLGFRLRITAFVPLALVAAIVVGQIAAFVAPWIARDRVRGLPAGPVVACALALVPILIAPAERSEGVVRAHPAMVASVMALDGAVPTSDTIVVSERHIEFMVGYYTHNDVTLRPEPIDEARRWRLMPLAFIGVKTSLYHLLLAARATQGIDPPRGFHPGDPNGLVVVPEATWSWILARLPPTPQRHYREWHTI